MRKRVDEMVEAKSAELNAMKEKCQQYVFAPFFNVETRFTCSKTHFRFISNVLNKIRLRKNRLQEFAERAQREIDEHKKRVSSAEKKAKGTFTFFNFVEWLF